MTGPRTVPPIRPNEKEFTAQVIDLARMFGWLSAHFRPAKTATGWRTPVQGDGAGWPDLFLVRGCQALAAELKVGRNKPSAEQDQWLDALRAAGIPAFVWRPSDLDRIVEVLR